jgi:hypothetical protein
LHQQGPAHSCLDDFKSSLDEALITVRLNENTNKLLETAALHLSLFVNNFILELLQDPRLPSLSLLPTHAEYYSPYLLFILIVLSFSFITSLSSSPILILRNQFIYFVVATSRPLLVSCSSCIPTKSSICPSHSFFTILHTESSLDLTSPSQSLDFHLYLLFSGITIGIFSVLMILWDSFAVTHPGPISYLSKTILNLSGRVVSRSPCWVVIHQNFRIMSLGTSSFSVCWLRGG